MTTVVNNPSPSGDSSGGLGNLIAVLTLLALGVLFFVYGLPALRSATAPSSPQINVPEEVDVNINQPQ